VLLLQSFFTHEGCGTNELAVFESTEIEVAAGTLAKALRDNFRADRAKFLGGFAECERVGFEGFEANPAPLCASFSFRTRISIQLIVNGISICCREGRFLRTG